MTTRNAHLDEVYPHLPFEPVRGEGVWLEDTNGRRVLDLYGGHAVAALGYGHPQLTEAIRVQAETMVFQTNAVPLAVRARAATKLAEFGGGRLPRVFFVNSGAEANENALKLACKLTGRSRVIAIEHGFHGRTAAAAAVTWGAARSWYGFPRTPFDVTFVPRDDIDALAAAAANDVAAVILEPVQGLAGAYDFDPAFVAAARELSLAAGAMLILDEVQTGVGRLGRPFGADIYDVTPDFLTTAKGLGGGFPCGAVLMGDDVANQLKPGELGTTFGGGPLACAAIEAVLDTITGTDLLASVRAVSAQIREQCVVGPVTGIRGTGFLLGLRTGPPAAEVRNALLERGILAGTSADPHVLRLLPPLILEPRHVALLAGALGEL
jgi:acetylornithine/succinyldiaminopimelate/putrescine aminotransferase